MSLEETVLKIQKSGFNLDAITEGLEGNWYIRGYYKENPYFFLITPESGLLEKIIVITDGLVKEEEIDSVLEKHIKNYLTLTGIDFEENITDQSEYHRAIFFYNENYAGQIQLYIQEGVARVTYGLSKKLRLQNVE